MAGLRHARKSKPPGSIRIEYDDDNDDQWQWRLNHKVGRKVLVIDNLWVTKFCEFIIGLLLVFTSIHTRCANVKPSIKNICVQIKSRLFYCFLSADVCSYTLISFLFIKSRKWCFYIFNTWNIFTYDLTKKLLRNITLFLSLFVLCMFLYIQYRVLCIVYIVSPWVLYLIFLEMCNNVCIIQVLY